MTQQSSPSGESGERALPSGTVTFLFTDIEGSTKLLIALGDRWERTLEEHRARIRRAVADAGGREVNTEGDALFVVFASPSAAIAAAADAQRALALEWPDATPIRVRMGIHTGEATLTGDDYVGFEVHRAARIGAAGNGGQVLISSVTRSLVEDRLPAGVTFRDLGEHRLKDIARPERLTQLVIDGLANDFPPPRTLDATPNNLPTQLTSFVGRSDLLGETRRLLERSRLLTLTGPGGTGKTRLALELAADVAPTFADGVYFVALASLSDPELFAPTVAAAAGIPLTGSRPPLEQLIAGMHSRRTLLVLDNFEQLLGAAPMVAELLRGTEFVKAIVTSRAILRVSGEQELPVPPLALPDPGAIRGVAALSQYDAVRLFIERAMAARPGFEVTNENAPAVAEITARLDGLPLAIELAAARLRVLSPQAILARLGDRLALLSGGARDLPARQQTLRAAIAWSYDLLDDAERDLFARLGVFVGGWTLDAAESVTGAGLAIDVFDGVGSLTEKSLVRSFEDAHGDPRFLMLETIHAFAMEAFEARPDAGALKRAHAAWFARLVTEASHDIAQGNRRTAFERLEDDLGNIRAAVEWLTANDVAGAAAMATDLWRFWQMRGYLAEGRARIDAVIAADDAARALSPDARRAILSAAGGTAYWQGDLIAAHGRYAEALDLARTHGTQPQLAEALYDFSFVPLPSVDVATWQKELAVEAMPSLNEAMAIFRALADRAGIAKSLWARAEYDFFRGDFSRAEADLAEALEIFEERGDRFQISWTLHSIGLAHTVLGNLDAARAALTRASRIFLEDGDITGLTLILVDFAGLEQALGREERALRLTAAADQAARRTGAGLTSTQAHADYFPPVPYEPEEGSPGRSAWDDGARMTIEEAIAYALSATADDEAAPVPAGVPAVD